MQRLFGKRAAGSPSSDDPVLSMGGGSFQGNDYTASLLAEIGGGAAIRRMCERFYDKAFADPHLDQFIRSHADPHSERLGNWIVEKMGGEGTPWTAERATRPREEVELAGGHRVCVHDRSSAHVAAWHSPKRPAADVGDHFQLNDARNWMRLMFWSAREEGLLAASPRFGRWFCRFIAHFVRVYERKAPPFARESMRWSTDPAQLQGYLEAGSRMTDVHGLSHEAALAQLPRDERADSDWPYHR